MALSPVPEPRPPLPAASEDPLHLSLAAAMERRSLSVSAVGSLLRAEGIAISRTRLHQLSSGTGAPPTAEQLERLASVLGVSPGYFAEYRLWRARALLDPGVVGFDRAMANFDRLRGRRGLPMVSDADEDEGPRYPGRVSSR
jgi:transcriptional regulator with XRE-family HTH domain